MKAKLLLISGSVATLFLTAIVSQAAAGDTKKSSSDQPKETVAKPMSEKEKRRKEKQLRKELETPYKKWLNEDVGYIITDEEKKAFSRLNTDEERQNFIEQF